MAVHFRKHIVKRQSVLGLPERKRVNQGVIAFPLPCIGLSEANFSNDCFNVFTVGEGKREHFIIIDIAFGLAKVDPGNLVDVHHVAFMDP